MSGNEPTVDVLGEGEEESAEEATKREEQILAVAKHFENHPLIKRRMRAYRTNLVPQLNPTDVTGRYLQEIGTYRLLTEEDEHELFGKIETALEVIERLGLSSFEESFDPELETVFIEAAAAYKVIYTTNTRLVISHAKKYSKSSGMPLIDLISEGNLGLARAIQKFDISQEFKFSTYATWWVRQQITRAIGDTSRLVRLPVHAHERYIKMRYELQELSEYLDRPATIADLAEVTGEKVETLELYYKRGQTVHASLDVGIDDGNIGDFNQGTSFGELMPELWDETFGEQFRQGVMRQEVEELFAYSDLDRRERFILSFRAGLDLSSLHGVFVDDILYEDHVAYFDFKTLEEVGEIFGLTRERIRQIEAKALDKIRSKIDSGLLNVDISSLS